MWKGHQTFVKDEQCFGGGAIVDSRLGRQKRWKCLIFIRRCRQGGSVGGDWLVVVVGALCVAICCLGGRARGALPATIGEALCTRIICLGCSAGGIRSALIGEAFSTAVRSLSCGSIGIAEKRGV